MEGHAHQFAELYSGETGRRFSLISPNFPTERWEIDASRRDDKRDKIQIVEIRTSTENPHAIERDIRLLNLTRDKVLPLYAIAEGDRTEWTMKVRYEEEERSRAYPFPTRDAVHQFQALLTGYVPVCFFENVELSLTYNVKRRLRDGKYTGRGEVQFWRAGSRRCVPRRTPASSPSTPASSTHSAANRSIPTMRTASIHTNPQTGSIVVESVTPEPLLLVAFLKDDAERNSGGYTMIKAKVVDFTAKSYSQNPNHLDLRAVNGSTFEVQKLSVGSKKLENWSFCELLQPRSENVETLKCCLIWLQLVGPGREQERDEFEKQILMARLSLLHWMDDRARERHLFEHSASTIFPQEGGNRASMSPVPETPVPQLPPLGIFDNRIGSLSRPLSPALPQARSELAAQRSPAELSDEQPVRVSSGRGSNLPGRGDGPSRVLPSPCSEYAQERHREQMGTYSTYSP